MKCIQCNNEIADNKVYGNCYCRNCWWSSEDKSHLTVYVRDNDRAPNFIDGRWVDNKDIYHKDYARVNLVFNKFTNKHEKYTGEPCPEGLVRHHEFYDLNDINRGIVFMTQSDHMKLHAGIRFGHYDPIPIYCEIDGVKHEYVQRAEDIRLPTPKLPTLE